MDISREAQVVMRNKYTIWGRNVADVPVKCLVTDGNYQRPASRLVKDIAENYDPTLVKFLEVSYRDGLFHVIDGQNRLAASKIVGVESLPCIIYEGLTEEEEARRFAEQQNNVTRLTTYDIYHANICNGNRNLPLVALDMQIKDICEAHDIPVVRVYGKGLTAINLARDIVSSDPACFEWICSVLEESRWLTKQKKIGKLILSALWRAYKAAPNKEILCDIFTSFEQTTIQIAANIKYPGLSNSVAFINYIVDLSTGAETKDNIIVLSRVS